jgi:glycosyltransferase involved in cell wall biosynthesis
LRRVDQCFVHDREEAGRLAATGVPAVAAPPAISPLPEPSPRRLAEMVRLTGDATIGRLIIAAPWPADREAVVWLRDAVAPLLSGNPLVLLLGAPRGRDARLLLGAIGHRRVFRLHRRRIDADVIAAAARCADAFVVPAEARGCASTTELVLALIASRVPVVVGGGMRNDVLEHERNALLVEPGDPLGLASSLNKLMAMPAIQRHYLGEEFAAHTLARWSWQATAAAYEERFAALVGRPQIPADLRAA